MRLRPTTLRPLCRFDCIIDALLRVWSVTTTSKEVLFLNEVEEVLEMTQPPEFQKIQVPLFNRIADCIRSPHFQVAERALFIWNNDDVVKLINQSRQVTESGRGLSEVGS